MTSIVVAFTHKSFGIGRNGSIPWKIPEDLKRFRELTEGSVVVMGRKTYESIGKPLPNRKNIVITSNNSETCPGTVFVTPQEADMMIDDNEKTYIIGGSAVYDFFIDRVDTIYATIIEKEYDCDTFFPVDKLGRFEIASYSHPMFSEQEGCSYRYVTYKRTGDNHGENAYLSLLREVMSKHVARPDRTGVGTVSVFARQMRFDISRSVPFVTTKMLAWRSVVKELLWFLRGDTNSKHLEAEGVGIWRGNTTREFLDNRGLTKYQEGDIGPMYGWMWRHIGAEYDGCDVDYKGHGIDQIKRLIDGLKKDPYSRRHMITTFCPLYVDQGVLPPCHGIVTQMYVDDGKLSCHVYNRSQDMFLGQPFNIASYAVFTHLIAKLCGMVPDELIISTGDTHIYLNHLDQVREQLSRPPLPFPVLQISDAVLDKDIDDISIDDFKVVGYLHHPAIKAPMAV